MKTVKLTIHEADDMDKILIDILETTKKNIVKTWNDPDLGNIYDAVIERVKNAPLTGTMMYLGQSAMQIELFGGMLEVTKNALRKAMQDSITKQHSKERATMINLIYCQIKSQTGELAQEGCISAAQARDLLKEAGVPRDYWKLAVPAMRNGTKKAPLDKVDATFLRMKAESVKHSLPFDL